jgi:hypothetical protein
MALLCSRGCISRRLSFAILPLVNGQHSGSRDKRQYHQRRRPWDDVRGVGEDTHGLEDWGDPGDTASEAAESSLPS